MASKPSDLEIASIVDSLTLAEWCGFDTVAPTTASGVTPVLVSSIEAFLIGLGLGPTEHFRILAALSPADYAAGVAGIQFNGASPSLKERGAMMLFHQTARRLCLLEDWPSVAPPAQTNTSRPASSWGGKLLSLASIQVGKVMDQKTSDEITHLAADFV